MSEKYGFWRTFEGTSCADARRRIEDALQAEGFGILTEIDVQATFREKLGREFRPYAILGACTPQLAEQAIDGEEGIGLLMPCNVVVTEDGDGNARVGIIDPNALLQLVESPDAVASPIADARERVQRALAAA